MGNSDQESPNKTVRERVKAIMGDKTLRDWLKVLAPYVTIFVVLAGTFNELHQFRLQREKEAVRRYLNIMRDLGDPSDTVRAAAAITMDNHLKENYDKYGEQSIPVFVNQLATEPSPLVRSKILSILMSYPVKTDNFIKPLVSANRSLTTQLSPSVIESHIRGEPLNENLLAINKALVAVIEKKLPEELDLSKLFLIEWSSEGTNLEQANFEGTRLMRCSFKQANLKKANLRRAELYQVDLTGASLQKADLRGATLREVTLKNANLNDAILESTNLHSSDLREANLTDAHLAEATLVNADMEGAILQGADLFVADLTEVNLASAILKNAILKNAILQGAILRRADLEGAFLQQADLFVADLTDANLTSANLEGANLEGANLEGANLKGANLEGANLKAEVLLRIDPNKFQSDLDRDTISKGLQQEFGYNGIYLSQNTTVSIEEKDSRWLIADEQTYSIEKKDGQLKIYEMTKLDPIELFSIDSKKFQSDLDKGTISEILQQEFEGNGFYLSHNTAVSVEEKDRRWLINDKGNKRTYTVRKEEGRLNICKETKFDLADIKKARNWQKAIFDDDVWQKLLSQQN